MTSAAYKLVSPLKVRPSPDHVGVGPSYQEYVLILMLIANKNFVEFIKAGVVMIRSSMFVST